jgi:L,D-peptidoglycan transpeptidase YkuD (ErfK/YbiS/YcfS/YnhG family)
MIFPVFTSAVGLSSGVPDVGAGWMALDGTRVRCALGRSGVCAAADKREGDGHTPSGTWPLRRLLWRADRQARPVTRLPAQAIDPEDGWCDDPGHAEYNRPVCLPHPARAERLWRDDRLYDLVVVLGHNDDPVTPGAGSAIFLHLARPDYAPTEGCVALARPDLLRLLALAAPGDQLEVASAPGAV